MSDKCHSDLSIYKLLNGLLSIILMFNDRAFTLLCHSFKHDLRKLKLTGAIEEHKLNHVIALGTPTLPDFEL